MSVEPGDWTAHRRIADLAPWDEGVRILGIMRPNGRYVGAPIGVTEIRPGDTLVAYGRAERLAELDCRRADADGDAAHEEAAREQHAMLEEESDAGGEGPLELGES